VRFEFRLTRSIDVSVALTIIKPAVNEPATSCYNKTKNTARGRAPRASLCDKNIGASKICCHIIIYYFIFLWAIIPTVQLVQLRKTIFTGSFCFCFNDIYIIRTNIRHGNAQHCTICVFLNGLVVNSYRHVSRISVLR